MRFFPVVDTTGHLQNINLDNINSYRVILKEHDENFEGCLQIRLIGNKYDTIITKKSSDELLPLLIQYTAVIGSGPCQY